MKTAASKWCCGTTSETLVLALRPKQAATALGISERLLWTLTKSGEIPHKRIRRAVVYPVDLLRGYLHEKTQESMGGEQ